MSIIVKKEAETTTRVTYDGVLMSMTASYLVTGTVDENAAFAAVREVAPYEINNLAVKSMEIDEYKGGGTFTINVNYEVKDSSSMGADGTTEPEAQFNFDTSGGTAKITTGKKTVYAISAPDSFAPMLHNGINYDGEKFNGVDIIIPNLVESYSKAIKLGRFTTSYKRTLAELTGTINNAKFKGWEAGECLFLGASVSGSATNADDLLTITYKFAISPNATGIEFAGLTIPEKLGWHYAWALFNKKSESDDDVKTIKPKADAVYVEQVYDFADFKRLGI